MALVHISEFDTDIRFSLLFHSRTALCDETGAYLCHTNGYSKASNGNKYILILPNESLEERGGHTGRSTWERGNRKFIRAWSDDEAIEKANKKLAKMLSQKQNTAAQF